MFMCGITKQKKNLIVFLCRCCRFAPKTCEQTSAFISTGRCSKNTRLSVWPATAVCEPLPWSFRPSTAPRATSSTTPAKASTASALWCQGLWRSSRTMKSLLFWVSIIFLNQSKQIHSVFSNCFMPILVSVVWCS